MNKNPATATPVMPSSAEANRLNRRDFLTLAWKSLLGLSGLLGLGGILQYLSYQPDPAPVTKFDLGSADQFPTDARALVPEARAIVIHTPTGFQALSLVCPHLGCTIEQVKEGFACPCHGSHFSPDGSLLQGPADRPLRALHIETTEDGRLILNTAEE